MIFTQALELYKIAIAFIELPRAGHLTSLLPASAGTWGAVLLFREMWTLLFVQKAASRHCLFS